MTAAAPNRLLDYVIRRQINGTNIEQCHSDIVWQQLLGPRRLVHCFSYRWMSPVRSFHRHDFHVAIAA